jgi:hypothetical protein
LGLEEKALAFAGENPFADVPEWGIPYVAFAFSEGITNGISDAYFGSDQYVTCRQFTAFLLRALGYYEKNGDFAYENTLEFALKLGLYDKDLLAKLNEGQFLRGKAVMAMVKALTTVTNTDDEVTLLDKLVSAGVITKEEAASFLAGLII